MAQNISTLAPPPIPTRIPLIGPNGLASKEWVAYFTWFGTQYAFISSPAFTGGPTVPTAPPGTDSTQIANTEFVTDAVQIETTRAEGVEDIKAPIDSPVFTGPVTQPEPTILTDASVATTATAGPANALPSTPAGYLEVSINNLPFKIPYFGA